MRTISLLFFLISIFSSCNANQDFKKLKGVEKYILDINNLDNKSIGYKHFEMDMDIGVNSMFVFKNIIYLPDLYHKNIKAFNIETGKLSASEELFSWFTDIVVFNQKLFVVSEYDGLKILDLNLNIEGESFSLPKGYKYFAKYNEDLFIVNTSIVERYEGKVAYECYNLNSVMKNKVDKINLLSDILPERVGYYDKELRIENILYLQVEELYYEIPYSLEKIKEYDAFNIFVESQQITYYYIDKNHLKIEVFKY